MGYKFITPGEDEVFPNEITTQYISRGISYSTSVMFGIPNT